MNSDIVKPIPVRQAPAASKIQLRLVGLIAKRDEAFPQSVGLRTTGAYPWSGSVPEMDPQRVSTYSEGCLVPFIA